MYEKIRMTQTEWTEKLIILNLGMRFYHEQFNVRCNAIW